jgi:hypothetical protein
LSGSGRKSIGRILSKNEVYTANGYLSSCRR